MVHAFIPAAGLGERLRPITDLIPKPLLPLLGRPILDIVLERVQEMPVDTIGINLHHKGEMIREWVQKNHPSSRIRFFDEDSILGTGGALKNAQPLLGQKHFLVHNADVISDIDLGHLAEQHLHSGNVVTLAIHDYAPFNTVIINEDGNLEAVGSDGKALRDGSRLVAFTGVAVYAPQFLDFLPLGRSHVVDGWLNAISSGMKIGTADVSGSLWRDVGTPDAYASAVFASLKEDGEALYIHPSVPCSDLEISGAAVIEEESRLSGPVIMKNCIILPHAEVQGPATLENTIVGKKFQIPLSVVQEPPESLLYRLASSLSPSLTPEKNTMQLIGAGGSDRRYYRIPHNRGTAVLLCCHADDPDYERQIAYTVFFRRNGLPVPDLLGRAADNPATAHTAGEGSGILWALFEDLGDMSLYSWLKCNRDPFRIRMLYERVLDILGAMHAAMAEKSNECPLLAERAFDFAHLRWETSYFLDRFVTGLKGVQPPEVQGLDEEFRRLALKVDGYPKTVIHRDFQSQNIMVTKGDVPRIIDYQGARIGPPAYDLVSLLWDPYSRLEHDMRDGLIKHYLSGVTALAKEPFSEDLFMQVLLSCRLQRHMQALGAYAFLASEKRKTYFLKYVPEALRYLKEETDLTRDEYPCLFRLVHAL